MATGFNQSSVAVQPSVAGITRQKLLTPDRVKGARVLLDRLTVTPGAELRCDVPTTSLAWLQLLDGAAKLEVFYPSQISPVHSVVLPPGSHAKLTAEQTVSLLYAEVPNVAALDKGAATQPALFEALDWTREPVFESKQDGRKRICLVNASLCNTTAIRVDMVIYPSGSKAPSMQQTDADAFIYVLSGRGTASAGQAMLPAQPGEVIYFPDGEWRSLSAESEMRFLQFYVPGAFKTVWSDPRKTSAWVSTDRDIHGRETARDARERQARKHTFGNPFVR